MAGSFSLATNQIKQHSFIGSTNLLCGKIFGCSNERNWTEANYVAKSRTQKKHETSGQNCRIAQTESYCAVKHFDAKAYKSG